MANELKIPHVIVSIIYGFLQALIFVGYILSKSYSYWYLGTIVVILSLCYLIFKMKYFKLHKTVIISTNNI